MECTDEKIPQPASSVATQETISDLADRLVVSIGAHASVMVAFSGGVDSAVVAYAARRALGEHAVAITGVGAAVPQSDIDSARLVANRIGIRHVELRTDEIANPDYIKNDGRRCFHCKTTLYSTLKSWGEANGYSLIASGTNLDDLGDYRPGLQAAQDHGVVTPLADLGITKALVRELARFWDLHVADKPASPCLASRIAYGQQVTPEKLRSIESLEVALQELGFHDVRVRVHAEGLVRIEVNHDQLVLAVDPSVRSRIVEQGKKLGFSFITIDLGGRQSGSLNRLLPIIQ